MGRKMLIGICLVALLMGLAGYFTRGFLSPKVGICIENLESTDNITLEKELRETLVLAGYTVFVEQAGDSQATQVGQVQKLLLEKVDVLVVDILQENATEEILQMAVETPVIFIGDEPENIGNGYYVGLDKTAPGKMQAHLVDILFQTMDVNGDNLVDYVVLTDEGNTAFNAAVQGTLKQTGQKTVLLEVLFGNGTAEAAQTLCTQAISRYGMDLEVIFCSSDEIALGAIAAVEATGLKAGKDVLILGVGGTEKAMEALSQGKLLSTITENPDGVREKIVQMTKALANGKALSGKSYVNHIAAVCDNIG